MINLNQTVSKKFAHIYKNVLLAYSLFMLCIAFFVPRDEINMILCPLIIAIGGFVSFFNLSSHMKVNDENITWLQIMKSIFLVGRMMFIAFLYVAIVFKRVDYIIQLILCLAFNIGIEVLCYYYYEKK